jgi:hypothetical protein
MKDPNMIRYFATSCLHLLPSRKIFKEASMSRKTLRQSKIVLIMACVILSLSAVGIAWAQGQAWAYGIQTLSPIRGIQAQIWTGTPPNGLVWTASPVGICNTSACNKIVETGFVKGTAWDLGDVLQQYATYIDTDGSTKMVLHLGNLANNTWYTFKTLYSTSAARWEAWNGTNVVWFQPHSLGWTSGAYEVVGSEAASSGSWMGVQAINMQYKSGTYPWTLYDYGAPYTGGQGCVTHRTPYGLIAWGPC